MAAVQNPETACQETNPGLGSGYSDRGEMVETIALQHSLRLYAGPIAPAPSLDSPGHIPALAMDSSINKLLEK
jgi:hypothetical protein